MAPVFSFIGETNNAQEYIEWAIKEQTAVANKMTNEGWIQVNKSRIVEADRDLGLATTKRIIDGDELWAVLIRFIMNAVSKFVSIGDPAAVEWENFPLAYSEIHPRNLSCIDNRRITHWKPVFQQTKRTYMANHQYILMML